MSTNLICFLLHRQSRSSGKLLRKPRETTSLVEAVTNELERQKEHKSRQLYKQIVEMIGDSNGMLDYLEVFHERREAAEYITPLERMDGFQYGLLRRKWILDREIKRLERSLRTRRKFENKDTFRAMFAMSPEVGDVVAKLIINALGKRGPARKDPDKAWRGAAVKIMALAFPEDMQNRYMKIAKACKKAGVYVSRQLVRGILKKGHT